MKSYRLDIDGMTCEHCADRVTEVLRTAGGVREAAVDLANKTATVVFDETQCGMAALVEAVRAAGFCIGGFHESLPPPSA
jgi:copper chaperone CopZ